MGKRGQADVVFVVAFLILLLMAFPPGTGGALGSAAQALRDALNGAGAISEGQCTFYPAAGTNVPYWQCLIIFGILPFAVLYYFIIDLLTFTMISEKSAKVISVTVALMATIPMAGRGTLLVNVTERLIALAGLTTQGPYGFLWIILILGVASAILGQFGVTFNMASKVGQNALETFYGLRTLRAIGREVSGRK